MAPATAPQLNPTLAWETVWLSGATKPGAAGGCTVLAEANSSVASEASDGVLVAMTLTVTAPLKLSGAFPPLRRIKLEEPTPVPLIESVRVQIEELIRAKLEEPALLDRGGKALLAVLAKARDDGHFLARLAEDPAEALKDYDLTSEEKAALSSGDIRWIESKLGTLGEPLRTWLTARLAQEKW